MNVRLTKDQKINIANSKDVYHIMQQVLLRETRIRRGQEHFWIVGLNNKNQLLFIELLALGQHNRVNMNPSDTFRMAIYKMATKVIFVHNHPSGNIAVSEEDKETTDYLYKAGKFLKIDVIDHLIISEKEFHSFDDSGLMDKIKTSGTWEIVDKTKADLTEMRTQIISDKASKKMALEIAKKMLLKGNSAELVKEYTGLTLREINKLLTDK